ncbi:MAG: nicotinate (nicotinamide) nucleotide adenylyltransferase [Microthrixaceae bacterium]
MGSRRRIALFGGTFDPPHVGHSVVAGEIARYGAVDEVLLVVANDPWQKSSERRVTPAPVRLEMARAAVAPLVGVGVSDIEIRRGGPSYTFDTVTADEFASDDVVLVVGSDTARRLDGWHRAADLAHLVEVLVVDRATDGSVTDQADPSTAIPWRLARLAVPRVDVSSTMVRARVAEGLGASGLVTSEVDRIIVEHRLYASEGAGSTRSLGHR